MFKSALKLALCIVAISTMALACGGGGANQADAGLGEDASSCADTDSDGVCDEIDVCPDFDDAVDADDDGVADGCDVCADSDDSADADSDGVPDGCDVCAGQDDGLDDDMDGVPDGCDICAGFDDDVDSDIDGVPNGCDVCVTGFDMIDSDADGVPEACDICPGFDDAIDTDTDSVPDGCDLCEGFDDAPDADLDTVPDGCDICAGFDDNLDLNGNSIPDDCEVVSCGTNEVLFGGTCYYLDGSAGSCLAGFTLAPQSILTSIGTLFIGLDYKTQVSDNCCIAHADQAAEGQDFGMNAECNAAGPFTEGPASGGAGCTDINNSDPAQLTLCQSLAVVCDPGTEVTFNGQCFYLDGSGGTCLGGYQLAPQSVLSDIGSLFIGLDYKTQISDNCCVAHADQAAEGQDFGMNAECNAAGPFTAGPVPGGTGCTDTNNSDPAQLTLCVTQ